MSSDEICLENQAKSQERNVQMSDESTALVPRRKWTPEMRRERKFRYPQPGRAGYPPSVKRRFLELVTFTEQSMEQICAMPGMPDFVTIWTWVQNDPEFAQAYENSKRLRAAQAVERVISDIAAVSDLDSARIMDLKAKHRLKIAALYDPARYSESMQAGLNRLPTGNAVQINIQIGEGQTVTVDAEGKKLENLKRG